MVNMSCIRSTDRVRIETLISSQVLRQAARLHPVYGPGED